MIHSECERFLERFACVRRAAVGRSLAVRLPQGSFPAWLYDGPFLVARRCDRLVLRETVTYEDRKSVPTSVAHACGNWFIVKTQVHPLCGWTVDSLTCL